MLKVYDDLFTDDFLVGVNLLCRNLPWGYANTANRYQFPHESPLAKGSHVFFGKRLYEKTSPYRITNEAPSELFDVLEHFVFSKLKEDLDLLAIDTNLQMQGQDGTAHLDLLAGNNQDRTIMFYPHYKWEDSWGGQLQVLDKNEEVTREYFPKPGRIIYFDSTVLHRALAPDVPNEPRMSIAFRMRKF